MNRREERDEELGAALRQLDVPPPRDDFYPRLLARLEAETEGGAAEGDGRAERAARWRRPWTSPMYLSAAAAVLLVVILATWVGVPSGRPRRAEAITAEEVRARVDEALTSLRTLTGEMSIESRLPGGARSERYEFSVTSSGDFRVDSLHEGKVTAYSTERGIQRSFSSAPGATPLAAEVTGLAPGPPDPAPVPSELSRSLGTLVRSFLQSQDDVPVEETVLEGRPGWRLVVPRREGGRQVGRLDLTVDRETGFPLHVLDIALLPADRETVVRELRVANVAVDRPLPPETFVPPYPAGTPPVSSFDRGFRRVGLQEAAGIVGYAPLVPGRIPAGFRLAEVTVAPNAPATGGNPPSRNVVSLAWQRGFDRFVVTTRDTGPDAARWRDPFSHTELNPDDVREPITVRTGSAMGSRGEVTVGVVVGTRAWVAGARLMVTVSGDLTRDELLAVLGSLQPA